MRVKYNNLSFQYKAIKNNFLQNIDSCLLDSDLILGKPVKQFESAFSRYIGVKYAIAVSSGYDALKLAFLSIYNHKKTAIYIQANTYVSTIFAAINHISKANIFLIDVDKHYQIDLDLLEENIKQNLNKFKHHIIVPVHMFGGICNMKSLLNIALKYEARVLEDASQAHGTIGIDDKYAGSYGDVGIFSLYPTKTLGAFGDAGVIATNNKKLYKYILMLRNVGQSKKYYHDIIGYNCRMDSIQAIALNEKLKLLEGWIKSKQKIASIYFKNIKNNKLFLPSNSIFCKRCSWHVFYVVSSEIEKLKKHLKRNNIEFNYHYLVAAEQSKALKYLKQLCPKTRYFSSHHVSIPIDPSMSNNDINKVIGTLNNFK